MGNLRNNLKKTIRLRGGARPWGGARECKRRRQAILAGKVPRTQVLHNDLLAALQEAVAREYTLQEVA